MDLNQFNTFGHGLIFTGLAVMVGCLLRCILTIYTRETPRDGRKPGSLDKELERLCEAVGDAALVNARVIR